MFLLQFVRFLLAYSKEEECVNLICDGDEDLQSLNFTHKTKKINIQAENATISPNFFYFDVYFDNFTCLSTSPVDWDTFECDPSYLIRSVFDCYTNSLKYNLIVYNPLLDCSFFQLMKYIFHYNKGSNGLNIPGFRQISQYLDDKGIKTNLSANFTATDLITNLNLQTNDKFSHKNMEFPLYLYPNKCHTQFCDNCRTFYNTLLPYFHICVLPTSTESYESQLERKIAVTNFKRYRKRKTLECECQDITLTYTLEEKESLNEKVHSFGNLLILSSLNQKNFQLNVSIQPFPLELSTAKIGRYKLCSFILYYEGNYSSVISVENRWIFKYSQGIYDLTSIIDKLLYGDIRLAFYDKC